MLIVPFVILIFFVVVFPRLMRFVATLCAFGALFFVASCIDHARADDMSKDRAAMARDADSFNRCIRIGTASHPEVLRNVKMAGGNEASVLIESCRPVADDYVHFCQAVGNTQDICFEHVRVMATDALKEIDH